MKKLLTALLILLLGSQAHAQQATGEYIASVRDQATTAVIYVNVEASASRRLRVTRVCVNSSPATAAAGVTVVIQRRTTAASSGGTVLTAEGTGATSVTKLNPNTENFPGVARLGGTPGTAGATVDNWAFSVPEIGAGTADPAWTAPICRDYNLVIPSGVTNGITVNMSAAGAGGLSIGGISVTVIAERE
jgi:hypothetical protein